MQSCVLEQLRSGLSNVAKEEGCMFETYISRVSAISSPNTFHFSYELRAGIENWENREPANVVYDFDP